MKQYTTARIRSVLLMFNAMIENNEVDYDFFNDYTGLSTTSFRIVIRIINEMIEDLNLKCVLETLKIINMNKYTTFYTCKYRLNIFDKMDYSYNYNNLNDEKIINYSITLVYLMLQNEEKVNYNILFNIFPAFTRHKFEHLIHWLRLLIDEELYKERNCYKLREVCYE